MSRDTSTIMTSPYPEPPHQEESSFTIWTKLDAEKQRQQAIRARNLSASKGGGGDGDGDRSLPSRSKSFDQSFTKSSPSRPSKTGGGGSTRGHSRSIDHTGQIISSSPRTSKSEEFLRTPSSSVKPAAASVTPDDSPSTGVLSAPSGSINKDVDHDHDHHHHHQHKRRSSKQQAKVKSIKTSHNRMPDYQTEHFQVHHDHHHHHTDGNKNNDEHHLKEKNGHNNNHQHPKTPSTSGKNSISLHGEENNLAVVHTPSSTTSKSHKRRSPPKPPDSSTPQCSNSGLSSSERSAGVSLPPAPDLVSPRPTSLNSAGPAETRTVSITSSPTGSHQSGGVVVVMGSQNDNNNNNNNKTPLRRKLKNQEISKSTASTSGDDFVGLSQYSESIDEMGEMGEDDEDMGKSGSGPSKRSGPSSIHGSNRPTDGSSGQNKKTMPEESERWLYVVACLLFSTTTAGLSCVILLVFGALGPQISDEMRLQNHVAYLSDDPITVFEDPISAQSRAIDWMINMDESRIDWDKDTVRRESRYALAVLFFATGYGGGNSWQNSLQFLSKNHECEWNDNVGGLEGQGVGCTADEKLINLTIVDNGLRGRLPRELSGLSDLKTMRLSNNVLTGNIPAFTFPKLEEMRLDVNRLDGPFPASVSAITSLRILNVTSNILSSTLPADLGLFTNLESLKVGSNGMTGTISENFVDLVQLRELDLSGNEFSGSIDMVQNFPNLEHLDLSSNQFTGTIPLNLGGLSNLDYVSLANNAMEGTIPSTIGFLSSLQFFDASNNILSGSFPWSFFSSNENQLKHLILAKNAMSGFIPSSDIFRLSLLEVVDFGRNVLTGDFPRGFGDLANLQMLDFSANKFDGTLPADLGFAQSLVSLNVAGNQIFGTIPSTLGRLDSLTRLNLQGNQFFGTVPRALGNLAIVERIGLHNNDLSGNIDFLCSSGDPARVLVSSDCGGNNPQVICSCCDVCLDA